MRLYTDKARLKQDWIRYTVIFFVTAPHLAGEAEAEIVSTMDLFVSGTIANGAQVFLNTASTPVGVVHAHNQPKGTLHVLVSDKALVPAEPAV
ncbi:MAG: hypothetical protein ACOZAO_04770 [Patescibacteria group bacterium]